MRKPKTLRTQGLPKLLICCFVAFFVTLGLAGCRGDSGGDVDIREVEVACNDDCNECDDLDSSGEVVDSQGGWDDLGFANKPWKTITTSVTKYSQTDASGKCGENLTQYQTPEGWVTAGAIPLGWWPTWSYGNCDNCLQCDAGVTVDKNGDPLCFKMTTANGDVYAKITDSCGGNCIGPKGTCGTTEDPNDTVDCAATQLSTQDGYYRQQRCSRAQLIPDSWGLVKDPCRDPAPGTFKDWCAGGKGDSMHIDLGESSKGKAFFDTWIGDASQWSIEAIRIDCDDLPSRQT